MIDIGIRNNEKEIDKIKITIMLIFDVMLVPKDQSEAGISYFPCNKSASIKIEQNV